MLNDDIRDRILSKIDTEAIIEMAKDAIGIPSPTGRELEMGHYMKSTFVGLGLDVAWQDVEEGRPNVLGIWEGTGEGRSLMFNGHMDTSYSGEEPHLTGKGFKPIPVIEDGTIFGLGIYNMKGALVCYTHAVRAVREAGLRIRGDVMIAAVTGEIEKSQWGEEFAGAEYRGYGKGSRHLVVHGPTPDMCILGEPTDMKIVTGHYGSMWVRISTAGPYMHTGFSSGRQPENSIRRMHRVLDGIVEWSTEWENRAAYGNKSGLVNIGGINGGYAWRASRLPERTDVYLDVRVPPTMPMSEARREVRSLVDDLRRAHPDAGITWEVYVSAPGAEISPDHDLVKAIESNHEQVLGSPPEHDNVIWSSDASVLTRYGIETVNYGPSSGVRKSDGEKVPIDVMVNTTRVYALTIADLCGAH